MKGHVVVFYTDLQIFLNVWTLNESYQVKLKQIHLFNLVWKDCIREIVDKMGYLQMAGFTPGSEEGILRQGLWRSSCKSGQLQVISPMWCFNFFFFKRRKQKFLSWLWRFRVVTWTSSVSVSADLHNQLSLPNNVSQSLESKAHQEGGPYVLCTLLRVALSSVVGSHPGLNFLGLKLKPPEISLLLLLS